MRLGDLLAQLVGMARANAGDAEMVRFLDGEMADDELLADAGRVRGGSKLLADYRGLAVDAARALAAKEPAHSADLDALLSDAAAYSFLLEHSATPVVKLDEAQLLVRLAFGAGAATVGRLSKEMGHLRWMLESLDPRIGAETIHDAIKRLRST